MLPAVNDSYTDTPKNEAAKDNKREEILDRIAYSLSSAGMNAVRDDAVVKTITSFSKALSDANQSLLNDLVEDDKELLKDVIKEFSNLQAKTSKDFADKLDKALKFAERLILRGEAENKPEMAKVGETLKEDLIQEKFKALGIDDDPTLGQRVKRRIFGNVVDTNPDGTKVSGWVQGKSILKNAGKDFAGGFSSTFMGGRFAGVSKSNEERREEVRAQAERENKQIAFVEETQRNLNAALDQSTGKDQITQAGGEEITQQSSANIAPDTKTRSDAEELKAGIRDTDAAFSRSATVTNVEDHWKKLLQLLEDIKKCVCECQCSGGMDMLPAPVPLPVGTGAPTRVPTAIPTRVPVAVGALEASRVSQSIALPAPAAVEAQGLARQITQARTAPALSYSPNNGTPLNFETKVREKVPVFGAAEEVKTNKAFKGRTSAEQAVAERFGALNPDGTTKSGAEIRANRANVVKATAEKMPAGAEKMPAAGGRRSNENIFTEEGRNNWRARRGAEAGEDALLRRMWEDKQRTGGTTPRTSSPTTPTSGIEPLPASRAPVPVGTAVPALPAVGTPEPVASPSMWEKTKTAAGNAWEGTKKLVSGGWEKVKSGASSLGEGAARLGRSALNLGTKAVKGTVDFTKKGLNQFGEAVGNLGTRIAESRVGKAVANSSVGKAVGKVAQSGAGRLLGRAGARLIPLVAPAIGAYEEGKREYKRTGSIGRALTVGGIAGITSLGSELVGTAAGAIGGTFVAPGAGTLAGGVVGGAAAAYGGQKAGGWFGSKVTDWIWGDPAKAKGDMAPAKATANGARQAAPAASIQQRPRASVQSGQNQDSAMIARSSAAVATARGVAERPVINVPPPTVIQAPANNAPSAIPHTRPHSRPEDNSWLTWQRRRTAVMA